MNSRSSRWVSAIGAVVVGGLLVTSMVAADDDKGMNPFKQITDLLNQILTKLNSSGGESNHTLRWDTNNLSASRFTTAFTGAVLDHNTGLVWEQAPNTNGGRTPMALAPGLIRPAIVLLRVSEARAAGGYPR